MLDEFVDRMVDDWTNKFPHFQRISNHIDLILGESLPNKEAYHMNPK